MMNETSKAYARLQSDSLWLQRVRLAPKPWLDIGAGDDPLPGATPYDRDEGDAATLTDRLPDTETGAFPTIPDRAYGLVWSSHCLEHLDTPAAALKRWWSAVRPGGYLWLLVPDFELYEKRCWPSRFNPEHHWAFSCYRGHVPLNEHLNLTDMVKYLPDAELLRLQLVDRHYDYARPAPDQTLGMAECSCEMVLRKSQ